MAFNPMVQDRSGEILAQGMAGFGASIGQGMQNFAAAWEAKKERDKREVDNGNIASKAVKTNPELLDHLGMSQHEFDGMSARDRASSFAGVVAGMANKAQADRAREEQAKAQADTEYLKAHAAALAQRTQGEENRAGDMMGFMQDFQRGQTGQPSVEQMQQYMDTPGPGPMPQGVKQSELEAFLGAGAAHPAAVTSDMLERMLPAIMKGGESDAPLHFEEDDVSGNRFAVKRNMVLPSGVNPKRSTDLHEVLDEDGNPTGMWTQMTPKGPRIIKGQPPGLENKNSAATLASLEESLRKIDDDLSGVAGRQARVDSGEKNNGVPLKPFEQSYIDDLKKRRARITAHMDKLDSGSAPAAAGASPRIQAPKTSTVDAAAGGFRNDPKALDIQKRYSSRQITKEQARKEMEKLGY